MARVAANSHPSAEGEYDSVSQSGPFWTKARLCDCVRFAPATSSKRARVSRWWLKVLFIVALAFLLATFAEPASGCPITLVSGAGDHHTIGITFRSTSKEPVRRLEFNCKLVGARANKSERASCVEPNASFLPGTEYTVSYAIPGDVRALVLVSVKSVLFADGSTWKPAKRDSCRTLKIKRTK
jgi:hypothetical protein